MRTFPLRKTGNRKSRQTKPIWNRRKPRHLRRLNQDSPVPRGENKAIYENGAVKRGGAEFVSRAPAHPLRRRFRSIWPISDLSADPMVMLPARTLGANHVSFVPESRWPLALEWRRPVNRTAGSGDAGRPSPNGGVVARKELKVYFFLPHARPVPVKCWCCTSWFGQWSPDPPSSANAGLPVPGRRRVRWRPPLSRTAGLETIAEQRLEPDGDSIAAELSIRTLICA